MMTMMVWRRRFQIWLLSSSSCYRPLLFSATLLISAAASCDGNPRTEKRKESDYFEPLLVGLQVIFVSEGNPHLFLREAKDAVQRKIIVQIFERRKSH
jgi:hypothetical protein